MKKIGFYLIILGIIGLNFASVIFADDFTGTWIGKTSQGFDLSI